MCNLSQIVRYLVKPTGKNTFRTQKHASIPSFPSDPDDSKRSMWNVASESVFALLEKDICSKRQWEGDFLDYCEEILSLAQIWVPIVHIPPQSLQ
ncbi:hypothetical protein Trydic_g1883 [Trypoxylus dichotomus]